MQESPQDWSDQETLLLLEGMEMYGENWAEIAEHVGTRSQVPNQTSLMCNATWTGHNKTLRCPVLPPCMFKGSRSPRYIVWALSWHS